MNVDAFASRQNSVSVLTGFKRVLGLLHDVYKRFKNSEERLLFERLGNANVDVLAFRESFVRDSGRFLSVYVAFANDSRALAKR